MRNAGRRPEERHSAVCPGIIETPMVSSILETQPDAMAAMMKDVPTGRLGRAEEIAVAVL